MIHATRENVNRCLRNWQRQGILDLDERRIVILQRESSEQLQDIPDITRTAADTLPDVIAAG